MERVQTQSSRHNVLILNAGDQMTLTTPISHAPGPQAQLAQIPISFILLFYPPLASR